MSQQFSPPYLVTVPALSAPTIPRVIAYLVTLFGTGFICLWNSA
jgi:hypothetical protein